MSKPIRLIAVLLICAVLLPAAGNPFTSASAAPLATSPDLGRAANFGVLGGSTVTNTGPSSIIGNLGVSPGTAVTGFGVGGGTLTGTIYTGAASLAGGAQDDVTTAYNALAGQACTTDYGAVTIDLVNLTLGPGVYCANAFQLSGTLTLAGNATDVWIFQSASSLITSAGGAAEVVLTGDGSPCNVWWQVGSSATVDTGTAFKGNILALTSIWVKTGAKMVGAALARNGEVTLDTNTISTCSGVNAIAMREFRATSAAGSPFGLGAGAGLLLALGLIVMRRRALTTPSATPSAPQGQGR